MSCLSFEVHIFRLCCIRLCQSEEKVNHEEKNRPGDGIPNNNGGNLVFNHSDNCRWNNARLPFQVSRYFFFISEPAFLRQRPNELERLFNAGRQIVGAIFQPDVVEPIGP